MNQKNCSTGFFKFSFLPIFGHFWPKSLKIHKIGTKSAQNWPKNGKNENFKNPVLQFFDSFLTVTWLKIR